MKLSTKKSFYFAHFVRERHLLRKRRIIKRNLLFRGTRKILHTLLQFCQAKNKKIFQP